MNPLTKRQALELLCAVVDQEVNEDEKIAFFAYLEKDPEVKKKYESALRVKKLLCNRCPKAKTPDRLKREILAFLEKRRKR